MPLTSTQIGAIGENLLINAVMKASDGRLSAFQPVADDDGIDVLFFDKQTGSAVAIQLKCRTATLRKMGSGERGNSVHFQVRHGAFREGRQAYLVGALCNESLTGFVATWFIPMADLHSIARDISGKLVIRASKSENSKDRFARYRCSTIDQLVDRIIQACETRQAQSSYTGPLTDTAPR